MKFLFNFFDERLNRNFQTKLSGVSSGEFPFGTGVDKLWTNTNKKICIPLKVLYLCIVKSIYKQLKTKHYDFITRHQFRLRYQSQR